MLCSCRDFMVKMTLLYFGTVHTLHRQLSQSSFQGDPWQEYKSGQTDSDVIAAIDARPKRSDADREGGSEWSSCLTAAKLVPYVRAQPRMARRAQFRAQ